MHQVNSVLIGIFLIMGLASCSDTDDSTIVGTYDIISVSLTDCGTPGDQLTLGLGNEDCIVAGDIEYCHDGVFSLVDNQFDAMFEISYLNQSVSIETEGSYDFDGDFIELTTSAGSITTSVNPANTEDELLSINFVDPDTGCDVRFVGKKR